MQIGKILGKTLKKPIAACAQLSPDILVMQKTNTELLSKNIASLQNFAVTTIPKAISENQKLSDELEKLAQIAKSSIK